jgi:hypothetical protein
VRRATVHLIIGAIATPACVVGLLLSIDNFHRKFHQYTGVGRETMTLNSGWNGIYKDPSGADGWAYPEFLRIRGPSGAVVIHGDSNEIGFDTIEDNLVIPSRDVLGAHFTVPVPGRYEIWSVNTKDLSWLNGLHIGPTASSGTLAILPWLGSGVASFAVFLVGLASLIRGRTPESGLLGASL